MALRERVQPSVMMAVAVRDGGRCRFPGCDQRLVDWDEESDEWISTAEIAHIRSSQPGGPRYDPEWFKTRVQGGFRGHNSTSNLLLMCPSHHALIDKSPNRFSIAMLESLLDEERVRIQPTNPRAAKRLRRWLEVAA